MTTHGTYLAPEEHAYPNGGQTRRCIALWPDGKLHTTWAGIPDTYFSIPAHGRLRGKYIRGYLTKEGEDDRILYFNPHDKAKPYENKVCERDAAIAKLLKETPPS